MDGWKNSGIYERGLKRFQFFLPVFHPTLFTADLSVKEFFKVLGSNMIIAAAAAATPPLPLPSRNHMPRTIEVKNKNTL